MYLPGPRQIACREVIKPRNQASPAFSALNENPRNLNPPPFLSQAVPILCSIGEESPTGAGVWFRAEWAQVASWRLKEIVR